MPLRSLPRIASVESVKPSAAIPITEATALSWVVADQPEMIGSRMPLTMKLSGLYWATQDGRLEHQVGREEGVREEEDHEDEREDPLDHAGAVRPERNRGADRAEGEGGGGGEGDDPDHRRRHPRECWRRRSVRGS